MWYNSMNDMLPWPSAAAGHDNTAALWNRCPPAARLANTVLQSCANDGPAAREIWLETPPHA